MSKSKKTDLLFDTVAITFLTAIGVWAAVVGDWLAFWIAFAGVLGFAILYAFDARKPSGGTVARPPVTFEEGLVKALGQEPVPIPGEVPAVAPEPHKLGTMPDACGICAAVTELPK